MPVCLHIVFGFCPIKKELSICVRVCVAHKAHIIYYLALYRGCSYTPVVYLCTEISILN